MPESRIIVDFTVDTSKLQEAFRQFALQMSMYGDCFVRMTPPRLPNATEYHRRRRHR